MKGRLDERLLAVASLVPAGARVADIGSDHAYLAMELFTEGKASYVVATDKNEGPCAAARRTLAQEGLAGDIPVRCGDGLFALSPGETDCVCIAGMGGELMTAILQASPDVLKTIARLVLQPMNDAPLLRKWLYENGWHIADEKLAESGGRLYEIIAAEPGAETVPKDVFLEVGPILSQKKPRLFRRHIEALTAKRKRILEGMKKSAHPDEARIGETEQKIRVLEEKLW